MAKPTMMQAYYLGLFRVARAFGLVFAILSVLIVLSNIPGLLRTGDGEDWTMLMGSGIAFPVIGALLFIGAGRGMKQYRDYIDTLNATKVCQICQRPLDVEDDPLSEDCGGDCWGCVGACEMDWEPSANRIREEIAAGLRTADGLPKPLILPGLAT